jgi:acetylglutamate kinase
MKKLTVLKIGGNVIDDAKNLHRALDLFSQIPDYKLLVHGGGKLATQLSERLNIKTLMIDGRRVTDADTLQVVVMTYAGWINKQLVAGLQARGTTTLGLSGADLNILQAHKRINNGIDYGFVGDIDQVNTHQLEDLLKLGITPVFCPITHDNQGQLFNTNADTIAAEIAKALSKIFEVTLQYCFEKKGVLSDVNDENSVIKKMQIADYEYSKSKKIIHSGMIPKLDSAFSAIQFGVKKVIIGDLDCINNNGGTVVNSKF